MTNPPDFNFFNSHLNSHCNYQLQADLMQDISRYLASTSCAVTGLYIRRLYTSIGQYRLYACTRHRNPEALYAQGFAGVVALQCHSTWVEGCASLITHQRAKIEFTNKSPPGMCKRVCEVVQVCVSKCMLVD